jgi:predicted AlkP superfamily pyrophosphatase or phosphodiesterase
MRNDYLYRYWNRFGEGGFKRLVNNGFYCKNTHYNYVPTYTGPGHCSIYTGATPAVHGIIANEWYSKEKKSNLYCTYDESVQPVGTTNSSGKMSPRNQLSTTLGDELKLLYNGKSKVFGVALKDRSSILPVGHAADAAFWLDGASGNFISSSWYMKDLPDWLKKFNEKKLPKTYLDKGWNTLYPIETYTASIADNNNYEEAPKGLKPVFPYNFSSLYSEKDYSLIKSTPWGNSLTKDIALECLRNEALGKDNICDMLCISFSSPDIIGHAYGLRAVEIEDVYLRLDKDLEEILNALDAEVGKDNYTLFLTADHGAADVANYLKDMKIPAGLANGKKIEKELKQFCKGRYGDSLIISLSNQQIFLNEEKISNLKLGVDDIEWALAAELLKMEGVAEAYPSSVIKYQSCGKDDGKSLIAAGYNFKRSGNVAFTYFPAWMEHGEKGTTHGASYGYDTHVPLIFFGYGIKKGENLKRNYITEIAPTISILLNMAFPNGCIGQPIEQVFGK